MEKQNEFREDKIAEIKEIMSNFDKENAGYYNCSDLGTILRVLGHNPDSVEIKKFQNAVDPENNGNFTFIELISVLKTYEFSDPTEKDIENSLELIAQDKNGVKGKIDMKTFKEIMMQSEDKLTEEEFEIMLKAVDPENSGNVNFKHFIETVK